MINTLRIWLLTAQRLSVRVGMILHQLGVRPAPWTSTARTRTGREAAACGRGWRAPRRDGSENGASVRVSFPYRDANG